MKLGITFDYSIVSFKYKDIRYYKSNIILFSFRNLFKKPKKKFYN